MSVKRFSLALVLCAAMAFTACDKEGGNQSGPDTDPVTPTENTVDVAYAIGGGADFRSFFDAEVKYTDAAGKTATEKISSLPWSKELTGLALPYTAKMEITLTARESYEEKEQYELGVGHAISYETSDGRTYGGLNVSKQTVGKDKIAKYQELMLSKSLRQQSKYRPNRELPDTAGEGRSDGRPSFSRNRSYRTAAGFIILQKREAMRRCRRMASFLLYHNYYRGPDYLRIAATPGSSAPSMYSRRAPPPVDT